MTFDAFETGDGRPVELYDFTQGGSLFRRTNAVRNVVIGSTVYEALPALARTHPQMNTELTSGEITVSVPKDFPIASAFRVTLPSSLPNLTIFRMHLNDPDEGLLAVWQGEVVNCKFGDNTAQLFCQPVTKIFDKPIPSRTFSATCNWQLYGRGCLVVRATYTKSTDIASTLPNGQTLTITNLRALAVEINVSEALGLTSDEIDIFWMRGMVVITGSPGERRSIVDADIGGDPDVVRINRPFVSSGLPGTPIDVVAGCNHNINGDCSRKFLNTPEFGGFPTVPLLNPFAIELDQGSTSNATSRVTPTFGGGRP